MNATTRALTFEGTRFDVKESCGQVWLRAAQIAEALGYAREDAVSRIYDRNRDEFSTTMSQTVKLTVSGLQRELRMFTLRGAHLIAMLARTDKAKAFRRWVLDILDREVGTLSARVTKVADTAHVLRGNLECLYVHMEYLRSWWQTYEPAIHSLNPNIASPIHDHFVDGVCVARNLAQSAGIELDTRAKKYPWREDAQARRQWALR